jgi:hypothetical protein
MNELISAETPKVDSDKNSDFLEQNEEILGPHKTEGDTSFDSSEPVFDKNRPNKLSDIVVNNQKPSDLPLDLDPSSKGLSRKKSEQNLNSRDDISLENKLKDLLNPPSKAVNIKTTTTPTNPFNSDNFFTQNFDDQEMDEAIEKLKNSSGKMGINSQDVDSTEVLLGKEDREEVTHFNLPQTKDNFDPSFDLEWEDPPNKESSLAQDKSTDLLKQVEKNKILKSKESRNSDIKHSKNEPIESELGDDDKNKYYGISDDVEFLKKKNKSKLDESRNEKRVQNAQHKSTNESLKEDIILDDLSDKPSEEDRLDIKNIIGSKSLDGITPRKDENVKYTENLNESNSKYATVSILSELNTNDKEKSKKLDLDEDEKRSIEVTTANKLTDLIYSAMLAEIKAELFPPRPLFLLTADLEKIELEQAMIYLNEMSVEKEAALLKEYLKYSSGDDVDFHSWDGDRNDRDSDESKMFSDSGKLVLYERKGISTDLFAIENYVDELSTEIDDK